jgi:hypothetical protein
MGLDLYTKEYCSLKTGDVLQWSSNNIIGRAIKLWTRGKFSHTGVVIRLPEIDSADKRRWTIEAVGKGVSLNYLSKRLEQFNGEVWAYPVKEQYRGYALEATAWIVEHVGTPYDTPGLFANLVRKVSADAKMLYCSEAVFLGWKYAVALSGLSVLTHLIDQLIIPPPCEITKLLEPVLDEGRRIF